jgi:hypothetical protein
LAIENIQNQLVFGFSNFNFAFLTEFRQKKNKKTKEKKLPPTYLPTYLQVTVSSSESRSPFGH